MRSDHPLHRRQLGVNELDLPDASVGGLALLPRQLQAREPLAACDAKQVRSQRARLTHWAPALGASVEPHFGPRMVDADRW